MNPSTCLTMEMVMIMVVRGKHIGGSLIGMKYGLLIPRKTNSYTNKIYTLLYQVERRWTPRGEGGCATVD